VSESVSQSVHEQTNKQKNERTNKQPNEQINEQPLHLHTTLHLQSKQKLDNKQTNEQINGRSLHSHPLLRLQLQKQNHLSLFCSNCMRILVFNNVQFIENYNHAFVNENNVQN